MDLVQGPYVDAQLENGVGPVTELTCRLLPHSLLPDYHQPILEKKECIMLEG